MKQYLENYIIPIFVSTAAIVGTLLLIIILIVFIKEAINEFKNK